MAQRTSRWHPKAPENFRLEVPGDLDILSVAARYRYIHSHLHAALLNRSNKGCIRRLAKLTAHGYLELSDQQHIYAGKNQRPLIHEITPKGTRLLSQHGIHYEFLTFASPGKDFWHAVMVCDTLASIEIGAKKAACRIISWSEILDQAPWKPSGKDKYGYHLPAPIKQKADGTKFESDKRVIPDAIFGIEYPDGTADFFAKEDDRGTETLDTDVASKSSYTLKELKYAHIIANGTYRKRLGLQNFRVLNIASTPQRAESIRRFLKPNNYMLVQSYPSFPKPVAPADGALFSAAYQRAGKLEPVYIDQ